MGRLMHSYCSPMFLGAFLPATALAYAVAPCRARPWLLLAASYACFLLISGELLALHIACTLVTYVAGRVLGHLQARPAAVPARDREARKAARRAVRRRMRLVVAGALAINVGMLIAAKYLGFLSGIAEGLLGAAGMQAHLVPPAIGMPIGISFYTLQAISYLLDVMRATVPAERNLGRLALYMAFFPQLMEGPICRYADTSAQLWAGRPIRGEDVSGGALRIAWGASKILIVADRVNLFVKPVFDHPEQWGATVTAMAAVLYTLQLYCDFSGTIDIVLGCARIFGVRLPENFRRPFCSRSASEFWQRWHITLGSWLRDYVFYPVSLSAPVKALGRTARRLAGVRCGSVLTGGAALGCVWLLNGLWHGAGWQYLLFGLYYFVLILGASALEPVFERMRTRLGAHTHPRAWTAMQIVRTGAVVCIGELIFRAPGVDAATQMLATLARGIDPVELFDGTLLAPGMDIADFAVTGAFCALLAASGVRRERLDARRADGADDAPGPPAARVRRPPQAAGTVPRAPGDPARRRVAVRCAGIAALVVACVIFGAYGTGYIPLDPIYAAF